MWLGAVPLTTEGALGSLVPSGTERVVLVRDDFEGHAADTLLQGTSADIGGIWQPLCTLWPSSPHQIRFNGAGGCSGRGKLYNDATLPVDVTIEARFTYRNAPEDNSDIVAGIFVRGQVDLDRAHTGGYFVEVDVDQDMIPWRSHMDVLLHSSSDTALSNKIAEGVVNIGYFGTDPVELTLRATVTGNRIQVWLNDVAALDYTDAENLFPTGRAGLWSNTWAAVTFDWVEIFTEAPADQVLAAPIDWMGALLFDSGVPPMPRDIVSDGNYHFHSTHRELPASFERLVVFTSSYRTRIFGG